MLNILMPQKKQKFLLAMLNTLMKMVKLPLIMKAFSMIYLIAMMHPRMMLQMMATHNLMLTDRVSLTTDIARIAVKEVMLPNKN